MDETESLHNTILKLKNVFLSIKNRAILDEAASVVDVKHLGTT